MRNIRSVCLLATLVLSVPVHSNAGELPADCLREARRAAAEQNIPADLLVAIAQVESGHQPPGALHRVPWPWTINADGRPYYFASKGEAVAGARELRAQGVRNLDVGCMQISLRSHPGAFRSLEEAFDPAANVAYSASFLRRLRGEGGSWAMAAGFYHSRTPTLSEEYRKRLSGLVTQLRANLPVAGLTREPAPPAAYPDRRFESRPPMEAYEHYRGRAAAAPADAQAALGLAVALERLARIGAMPMAEARVAYARVLALMPRNQVALRRLYELSADVALVDQVAMLEHALLISGGPAELAATLAERVAASGNATLARHYLGQAVSLGLPAAEQRRLERLMPGQG